MSLFCQFPPCPPKRSAGHPGSGVLWSDSGKGEASVEAKSPEAIAEPQHMCWGSKGGLRYAGGQGAIVMRAFGPLPVD